MTLIQYGLHELFKRLDDLANMMHEMSATHISLQIICVHIGFHANQVTQHPGHQVLPEDDYLLLKEPDSARVGPKVNLWHA